MRRDSKLVELFLRGYNEACGETYRISERPEQNHRQAPAVEAVALNRRGMRLAIEHTLVQPFVGEKDDSQSFLAVFSSLERNRSLIIPDYDITLVVPVGVVPKGVRWEACAEVIREWFRRQENSLPEGVSRHIISNVPFKLEISVEKTYIPGFKGSVCVMRSHLSDTLAGVLRKALHDKLPKLLDTPAGIHVLLLEKDNLPRGYVEIAKTIESLQPEFPKLVELNAIWLVNTVAWESEGVVWFLRIWPGGVTTRFRVPGQSANRIDA
jgi:hypothetical protein